MDKTQAFMAFRIIVRLLVTIIYRMGITMNNDENFLQVIVDYRKFMNSNNEVSF